MLALAPSYVVLQKPEQILVMGQFDRITFDGELYRLDGCGEVRLRARRGQRQAHAMHGRSEEPRRHPARR